MPNVNMNNNVPTSAVELDPYQLEGINYATMVNDNVNYQNVNEDPNSDDSGKKTSPGVEAKTADGIIRNPNSAVAPFLLKTYDLLSVHSLRKVIGWNSDGQSFTVYEPEKFSKEVLPKHFKHSNWSSFVRQLNTYGFRKVEAEKWVFSHDSFIKGKPELMKNIIRRKGNNAPSVVAQRLGKVPAGQAAAGGGNSGAVIQTEVERLREDKNMLLQGMVALKQKQEITDLKLSSTEARLEMTVRALKESQDAQSRTQMEVERVKVLLQGIYDKNAVPLRIKQQGEMLRQQQQQQYEPAVATEAIHMTTAEEVPDDDAAEARVTVAEVFSDDEDSNIVPGMKRVRPQGGIVHGANCSCPECRVKVARTADPYNYSRRPAPAFSVEVAEENEADIGSKSTAGNGMQPGGIQRQGSNLFTASFTSQMVADMIQVPSSIDPKQGHSN